MVDGQRYDELGQNRVGVLLAYLLLQRGRPCYRENLAELLGNGTCQEHRKQLRQKLWQLQVRLERSRADLQLEAGPGWVALTPGAAVQVDAWELEQAYVATHGQPEAALSESTAEQVKLALEFYSDDLLPACCDIWCEAERHHYRIMFFDLADRYMAHAEASGRFDEGLAWGEHVLRLDAAAERTHQRLMRLRHLRGDRTGALRQFERCERALYQELGVRPSPTTIDIREAVLQGDMGRPTRAAGSSLQPSPEDSAVDALYRLRVQIVEVERCATEARLALDLRDAGRYEG